MIVSAHQLNFMPYPGLLGKILYSDKFVCLGNLQFEKKSWQNRNRLRNRQGEILLTVPVLTKGKFGQPIKEVAINNLEPWKRKHLKTILSCYSKAPYFDRFYPFFEDLYQRDWDRLYDIDLYILEYLLELFEIRTEILYDVDFDFSGNKTDLLIDICEKVGCDTYLSNKGSEVYVDIDKFVQRGINHIFMDYTGEEYAQMKYGDFIPHLSVFDMLFNLGIEESYRIISEKSNYEFSEINQKLEREK